MESRLTEFSYGYCVTEELANRPGAKLKAAPYFPSLYAEGQEGGGYDVKIGAALFLQFKLCEELKRRSARETKKDLLQPVFYRFWLHRRNQSAQHRMLIELEKEPGNQVYYIAPGFADVAALDKAYGLREVVGKSAMFSPSEIGLLPDDNHHSIAFRPREASGWFLSDPKRIRVWHEREIIARAVDESPPTQWADSGAWLRASATRMISIARENQASREIHAQMLEERPLETVAYLARTHFGCELFLVPKQ